MFKYQAGYRNQDGLHLGEFLTQTYLSEKEMIENPDLTVSFGCQQCPCEIKGVHQVKIGELLNIRYLAVV